jgi:hypothetical protein
MAPDPSFPSAARDAGLAAQGWVRRFVASPPRLAEHIELYRSLGQDVHIEPVLADELDDACGDCGLALTLFRVIYTRRPR